MRAFFAYPPAAAFGRVVPKSKIYEHAGASASLKELFTRQVEKIIWKYKLAPETTNLAATPSVAEIQVFAVALRQAELNLDVLRAIDKAISFPLVFELHYSGKTKVAAAFKRPRDADSARWVVSEYFETDWLEENTPRQPFPVALDMRGLYEKLLEPLLAAGTECGTRGREGNKEGLGDAQPAHIEDNYGFGEEAQTPLVYNAVSETLEQQVARVEAIRVKKREIERIRSRLSREKQYNKRIAINAELRTAREQLARLEQN